MKSHNFITAALVLFKMADVNAEYFKAKLTLFKRWHPKESHISLRKVSTNLSLGSPYGITRRSLVMPNSDPRDRLVYPIHKLMINSYVIPIHIVNK